MTKQELVVYIARTLAGVAATHDPDDQIGNYKRYETRLNDAEVVVEALGKLNDRHNITF